MERFNPDMALTSTEAAELLGVHSSTVKRWCNDGELAFETTDGGHRRIHIEDAQAFARERGIETVLTPFHPYEPHVWTALEQVRSEGSFRRFLTLAMGWVHRAQLDRLGALVEAVAREDAVPFPSFCDEAVRGLMHEVGRAWHDGRLRAGEEHMVSQLMIDVLLKLRRDGGWGYASGPDGPGGATRLAVVGSIEGNQHHLGSLCIRLVLERRGWEVLYLGPDVPVEDFGTIQKGRHAELVCVSLSPPATVGEVDRTLRILGEFFDPEAPYTLALGGSFEQPPSRELLASGPFRDVQVYASCTEFAASLDADGPPRAGGGKRSEDDGVAADEAAGVAS